VEARVGALVVARAGGSVVVTWGVEEAEAWA
jgi:hypothetical protein